MKPKKRKWKWGRWISLLLLLILLLNTANIARLIYPVKYMDYVKQYALEYDLDPYLIMSVIKTESNFKQDAVSHKNATGLMQIMEPTAFWLAEKMELPDFQYEDVADPKLNIRMGCYYINYLLSLYDGDIKNALAAYNAGEGTVMKWLSDKEYSKDGKTLFFIPYPETRRYITKITNNQQIYELLYRVDSEKSLYLSEG